MGKWLGYKCLSLQFRNMNNIMYVSVVAVFDFFYVLRTRIFNIKLKIKYTRMKIYHRGVRVYVHGEYIYECVYNLFYSCIKFYFNYEVRIYYIYIILTYECKNILLLRVRVLKYVTSVYNINLTFYKKILFTLFTSWI